jgi:hypothetical protein
METLNIAVLPLPSQLTESRCTAFNTELMSPEGSKNNENIVPTKTADAITGMNRALLIASPSLFQN